MAEARWDPAQYAQFSDHRLRPGLDLLARVPIDDPATVVDLGCGTGNVTACLVQRWPRASVVGVDSSPEMLAVARAQQPRGAWVEADLARWSAARPVDVVFSNAALHWAPDHERLFPHLLRQVDEGGALAVQMPRNFLAPTHAIAHELAQSPPWRHKLAHLVRPVPVAEPASYHDLLAGDAARLDVWETEYLHALTGERPVLEWIKGSWLRPFLAALTADEANEFADEYHARATLAYPRRPDGVTLLPFRRLFLVAVR